MNNNSFFRTFILLLLISITFTMACADRGTFVMKKQVGENINVYDAGQKAVIAWNNGEEIMILSTDKYVSKDAKVLEFMPIPSNPSKVEKVDFEAFKEINSLIAKHRPRILAHSAKGNGGRNGERAMKAANKPAVEIVFHEKLGAHEITIAKTQDLNGFLGWIKKFLTENGMQYREEDVRGMKSIVAGYLKDGYHYYVFDVIDLTTEKKSIEPIIYKFKSEKVYFPLRVTQLSKGVTNVALYLLTPFKTDIWGTKTRFASGFYTVEGEVSYKHPIKFSVSPDEVKEINADIYDLLKGVSGEIWFSTAKFKGETGELTKDFIMAPGMAVKPGVTAGSEK